METETRWLLQYWIEDQPGKPELFRTEELAMRRVKQWENTVVSWNLYKVEKIATNY